MYVPLVFYIIFVIRNVQNGFFILEKVEFYDKGSSATSKS